MIFQRFSLKKDCEGQMNLKSKWEKQLFLYFCGLAIQIDQKMNFYNFPVIIVVISLLFSCKEPPPRPVVRIVPLPAEVIELKGVFIFNPSTKVSISQENVQLRQITTILNEHTEKYFGFTNSVFVSETEEDGSLCLKLDDKLNMGKEDYHLKVTSKGVIIEAAAPNGLFYGVQTLVQLMPPTPKQLQEIVLPAVEIKDTPRFSWRGLHLDVSRHFMPKEFILKFLSYMAIHKFNIFHLQLADDQGWRIELKKYPLLTEVGAVRKKTLIGHGNNPLGYDTIPTGGSYTKNDISEIVAYASERYITIVPGIEMPGHALAALASYPEIGCTSVPYEVGTRWGTFYDVYCAGKEETYNFLKGVITEMTALFPGKYFHIGGADCSMSHWENCPSCQQKMKNDSLNSAQGLHNYFVRRIGTVLDSLGKVLVGWDEVTKDTLFSRGVIMSWHNSSTAANSVKRKLQTVMSPAKYCNFDQYQSDPGTGPLAVGGLLTLEQVYNYEPIPAGLSALEARYIIGVQANVWTQYMKTPEYVEYMVFPRASALAEVSWSPKASRDYVWFRKRLTELVKRYDALGIRYCKAELKSSNN